MSQQGRLTQESRKLPDQRLTSPWRLELPPPCPARSLRGWEGERSTAGPQTLGRLAVTRFGETVSEVEITSSRPRSESPTCHL